jgi:hypothetical protein
MPLVKESGAIMKNAVLCLVLMLLAFPVMAEMEVIPLQHRSAEELLPVILPLLDKDGVASGMGNQLILRTSPRNLAEIKKLLHSLDTVPRRLKITVLQNADSETIQRLTENSSGGTDDEGLTAEAGQDADKLGERVYSTHSADDENRTRQIQVLEGSRALVRTGQSVPVRQQQTVQTPWNSRGTETTVYRDADSGFYVLPRLNGDRVTLEISSQDDRFATDADAQLTIRKHQLTTTVSGRLGEWMVLGDSGRQESDNSNTVSTRSLSDAQQRRNVLLKVEEAGD